MARNLVFIVLLIAIISGIFIIILSRKNKEKNNLETYSTTPNVISTIDEYPDSDSDGYPDCIELTNEEDRKNFLRWFNMIALSQYYHIDDQWNDRDCAGLLRFCYREALRKHDNIWLKKRKFLYDINIPEVKKYNYPAVPLIGVRLFRNNSNTFDIKDTVSVDSIFVSFEEAKYLKDHCFKFISKNIEDALPGDVLFYLNDANPKWPYHSMIFIGNDKIGKFNKEEDWVIYHTGPDNDNPGIIKKIKLKELNLHPNKRWHPLTGNPYFLGFFRWKIVDG